MTIEEFKVGDKVRFVKFGTIGEVVDIDINLGLMVWFDGRLDCVSNTGMIEIVK